jgi:hypothetical protein
VLAEVGAHAADAQAGERGRAAWAAQLMGGHGAERSAPACNLRVTHFSTRVLAVSSLALTG